MHDVQNSSIIGFIVDQVSTTVRVVIPYSCVCCSATKRNPSTSVFMANSLMPSMATFLLKGMFVSSDIVVFHCDADDGFC